MAIATAPSISASPLVPVVVTAGTEPFSPDAEATPLGNASLTTSLPYANAAVARLDYVSHPSLLGDCFNPFIGQSKKLLAVIRQIYNLRSVDDTVLIQGPTGSGKELAARAFMEIV